GRGGEGARRDEPGSHASRARARRALVMCGIAGWYARGGRAVDEAVVRAMCATITHRGPDDEGALTDGDFGFGMRRLSIVDVAGGHQPMTSEDGRFVV